MTTFFGERWDAPKCDHATPVPTPVGENCLYCTEPIEDGDQGLLTPYLDMVNGQEVSGIAPVHKECDLRMALGNVYHHSGQCRFIGDCHEHDNATWRQEARALLDYVNQQRARAGMGPM